jgi:hypothetical protein
LGKERFPFFAQGRGIEVTSIEVFADVTQNPPANITISYPNAGGTGGSFSVNFQTKKSVYGQLNVAQFGPSDLGDFDITKAIAEAIAVEIPSSGIEELYLVAHYTLA